jgi:hypothetical protein
VPSARQLFEEMQAETEDAAARGLIIDIPAD